LLTIDVFSPEVIEASLDSMHQNPGEHIVPSGGRREMVIRPVLPGRASETAALAPPADSRAAHPVCSNPMFSIGNGINTEKAMLHWLTTCRLPCANLVTTVRHPRCTGRTSGTPWRTHLLALLACTFATMRSFTLTHLLAHPPSYSVNYSATHQLSHPPTQPPTNSATHQLSHLPNHLPPTTAAHHRRPP